MRSLIAVAAFILTGCSGHYSTSDVAGKYALSVKGGVDTIELDAGGAYRHSYKAETGETVYQEDRWTLENLQAGPTVVLNNFQPIAAKNTQKRGFYLLLVAKRLGTLYLITNIDLNEGYKKEASTACFSDCGIKLG